MITHSSDLSRLWQYFVTIYSRRSSGQLRWGKSGKTVIFHFDHGHLIWCSSDFHRHRRWQRAVNSLAAPVDNLPAATPETIAQLQQSARVAQANGIQHWDYHALAHDAVNIGLTLAQVSNAAARLLKEHLFTLPAQGITQWVEEPAIMPIGEQLLLTHQLRLVIDEVVIWRQEWESLGINRYWADQGLKLRERVDSGFEPASVGSSLFNLEGVLNGDRTFWDVVLKMHLSKGSMIARLVQHFHSQGILEVSPLADLPVLTVQPPKHRSLVLCVDDSAADCHVLEKVVSGAGYDFLACQDPLTAVPVAIARKPSLVFLDLVMPVATGYEVCAQLRRVSSLQNLPVVILTSNNGAIDRVRAKLAKATAFLSKPIKPEEVKRALSMYTHKKEPLDLSLNSAASWVA